LRPLEHGAKENVVDPAERLKPSYLVVLHSNIPDRERAFLAERGAQIKSGTDGQPTLIYFQCTKIDTAHHYYIEMESFKRDEESPTPMWIPHHFVLTIFDAKHTNPFGFTAPE
jgi:hypothetical protein